MPGVADVVFWRRRKSYEIRVNPVESTNCLSALMFEAVSKSNINVGGDTERKPGFVVRGIGLLDKTSDIENISSPI